MSLTNQQALDAMPADLREKVLDTIAEHYGTSRTSILEEVLGDGAEALYEYIPNALAHVVYRFMHRPVPA